MLGRDHHGCRPHRRAVHVFERHLAFRIRAQAGLGARMAGLGERLQNGMGEMDRGRHQHLGLAAGVAEHQALVAGTLVLVASGVDALGDVRRLAVHVDLHLGLLPVKPLLLVANLTHAGARDLFYHRVGDRVGSPHFAGEHDAVGGAKGFDGDARMGVGAEKFVDHGVGDSVADLVGMAFGNRFAGEKILALTHGPSLRSQ